MKVPKMYKSSDRYNAGTDVIYNDDSKLQYAPFIYAGVTAKDNGDGGDDEEGEDIVVVNIVNGVTDATWNDIKSAVDANKLVMFKIVDGDVITYSYLTSVYGGDDAGYYVDVITSQYDLSIAPMAYSLTAANATDYMTPVEPGGGGDN